jgi:hypothetical protein
MKKNDLYSLFSALCSQDPRHVGPSSHILPQNVPTECITHKWESACSSEMLLSLTTKCHNPDSHKTTSNIKHNYKSIFLQSPLNAICLNSFLTSNELQTSHLCLLISTQFSQNCFHQKASRLAQHSQYNDLQ